MVIETGPRIQCLMRNPIMIFVCLARILLEDIDSHNHRNAKQVCYLDLLPEVATATTCRQVEILEEKWKME